MLELKVEIEGQTVSDLVEALREVLTKVEDDFTSGSDRNETGRYNFDVSGETEGWGSLDDETKEDLIAWYNVREEDLDNDDLDLLAKLYHEGKFEAWDCPECGERCYRGAPDDWGCFQGVRQVDYTSYPGDTEKYKAQYLVQMCDNCRITK